MGCRISQRMSWQSQSQLTLWQLHQAGFKEIRFYSANTELYLTARK